MDGVLQNGNLQSSQTAGQPVVGQPVAGQPAVGGDQLVPTEQPTGEQGSLDEQATGEEQEAYDRVVLAAIKLIFEEGQAKDGIIQRLKADSQKPAQSIADVSSMIVTQLDEQSGGQIPESVILPASIEILEQVSELSNSMNIFPVDEAVMNHAAQLMMVNLGDEYGVEQSEIQAMIESTPEDQLKQVEAQQGEYARKQPPQEVLAGGQDG